MDHTSAATRGLTEDRLLGGRVKLLQPRRGYRVAIDAVLLAAAIEAVPGARVLDLGAGVGAVGLCLAARVAGCSVLGVELQAELAGLAERSALLNGLGDRVRTIVHDLVQDLPQGLGPFDVVATNPPYLPASVADPSPDRSKALATVESSADLARWLAVACRAARPEGSLIMIHRADREAEIVDHLARLGWGDITIKRLPPAARVLVRARRHDGLLRRDSPALLLHGPSGGYTAEAEAILRHAAPLAL
ncbi:MAG: tRNA1(Val) (adenine(37)-N6)-methyltransferase [Reyranella sp.]|uniref:tRNA1(Val) (adenine(37)-N6)-methyltransferase n=1 Tax=Reyranella sp. TaxID=1929291 RepID=UPI003D0EF23E